MPDPADLIAAAVAKLKTEYPGADLYLLGESPDAIIVRLPSQAEWKAFKAAARDDNKAKALDAPDWLVNACCLWPEPAARDAIFARKAALPGSYANKIAEYAGADEKIAAKKL